MRGWSTPKGKDLFGDPAWIVRESERGKQEDSLSLSGEVGAGKKNNLTRSY